MRIRLEIEYDSLMRIRISLIAKLIPIGVADHLSEVESDRSEVGSESTTGSNESIFGTGRLHLLPLWRSLARARISALAQSKSNLFGSDRIWMGSFRRLGRLYIEQTSKWNGN